MTSNQTSDYNETILEAEETRKREHREGRAFGHTYAIFTGNGRLRCRINDARIKAPSNVTASIGEIKNGVPHYGDAVMTVHNVVPFKGGVWVRVNVDFDSDLDFQIMVTFGFDD